ncbi:hypothetical protein [Parasphingorhabdus pacifica]
MSSLHPSLGRRAFLARIGLLGAAVGTGSLLPPAALAGTDPIDSVADQLNPVLRELARDTYNGVTTFVVPGPDAYSSAQGTPREEPGALEARLPDFLMEALDEFLPFPQSVGRPVVQAVATGLSDSGIELPLGLDGLLPGELATLDRALGRLIATDAALPLSVPIALLLNLVASEVNPAAVEGPFLSPFARLSFEDKAAVFERLEGPVPELVNLLDAEFPEPLKQSVSGLLRFVSGALLEFSAFGGYSEYAVFDAETRELTGKPVGWRLTGFDPPEVHDGWDDFIGYYQNRQEVHD